MEQFCFPSPRTVRNAFMRVASALLVALRDGARLGRRLGHVHPAMAGWKEKHQPSISHSQGCPCFESSGVALPRSPGSKRGKHAPPLLSSVPSCVYAHGAR